MDHSAHGAGAKPANGTAPAPKMGTGCKISVSKSLCCHRETTRDADRGSALPTDALQPKYHRLLLPLGPLAHHLGRHVRRLLHRRLPPRRRPRSPPPLHQGVRPLPHQAAPRQVPGLARRRSLVRRGCVCQQQGGRRHQARLGRRRAPLSPQSSSAGWPRLFAPSSVHRCLHPDAGQCCPRVGVGAAVVQPTCRLEESQGQN